MLSRHLNNDDRHTFKKTNVQVINYRPGFQSIYAGVSANLNLSARRAKYGCRSYTANQGATARCSHIHRSRMEAICGDIIHTGFAFLPIHNADMCQHLVVCTSRVTGIVCLVFNKEADNKYPTHGMTEGSKLTLLDSWLVSHQPLVVVGSPHDWVHLFKNSSEHNDKN